MANGKLVWLNFKNIDTLTELTRQFEVKSPNNVVSILVDLAEKTKDIQLKQMRICPTCNKEFEIEDINSGAYKLRDHIRHCDLEPDSTCKQTCRTARRVKLGTNGTTTANDKNSEQTDTKDKVTKSWVTPRGLVETRGDFDYINGKKVRTYIGSDPQQPMLDEDYDDIKI